MKLRVVAFAMLAIAGVNGCAVKSISDVRLVPPGMDPWAEDLYSRNEIVAVPTLAGNVAGGIAGIALAGPILCVEWPLWKYRRRQSYISEAVVLYAVYLGGGITGTPFLPLALLLPEHRWIVGQPLNYGVDDDTLQRLESALKRAMTAAAAAEQSAALAREAARRAESQTGEHSSQGQ